MKFLTVFQNVSVADDGPSVSGVPLVVARFALHTITFFLKNSERFSNRYGSYSNTH